MRRAAPQLLTCSVMLPEGALGDASCTAAPRRVKRLSEPVPSFDPLAADPLAPDPLAADPRTFRARRRHTHSSIAAARSNAAQPAVAAPISTLLGTLAPAHRSQAAATPVQFLRRLASPRCLQHRVTAPRSCLLARK